METPLNSAFCMSSKLALKEAKRFIGPSPEKALEIADGILEEEPGLVPALLLKGVCLQRLLRHIESLPVLDTVLSLEPNSLPAWRGIMKAHVALKNPEKYFDATMEVLYLLSQSPAGLTLEHTKVEAKLCFSELRSFLQANASKSGSKSVNLESMMLLERFLEVQITPVDSTPEKIRQIHELIETVKPSILDKNALEELIYHRQRSLTKKLATISLKLKQTVGYTEKKALLDRLKSIEDSKIEELLRRHINTEDDDETRRAAESDLLELLVLKLKNSIGAGQKIAVEETRLKIKPLLEGMAMFTPSKPLAWELAWDWNMPSLNVEAFSAYALNPEGPSTMAERKHKKKKRRSPGENYKSVPKEDAKGELGKDLKSPYNDDIGKDDVILDAQATVIAYQRIFPETQLAQVIRGFLSVDDSVNSRARQFAPYHGDCVYGWLLTAQFYISQGIYESALDAARQGVEKAHEREDVFGMDMKAALLKFNIITASAYTNYQVPKNFGLAFDLYETVLNEEPENTEALIGKGLILSRRGDSKEAIKLLEHVISVNPSNDLALAELSWLFVQGGDVKRGIDGFTRCISIKNTPLRNAELSFKIGYAHWIQNDFEECFKSLAASLQYSSAYAPAFTYLGLFFEEVSNDKQRAQRCYYRALELDSGELIAAEKLSVDFANNSQWDLVEIIASTVLKSAKAKGLKVVDWPYKAMGIACLNQLKYEDAVKYFQKCLRSKYMDVHAWVGLGEAYIHCGRYSSAVKALKRALKLEPMNFSALYILSLAQRSMLDFPSSAASLKLAIQNSPGHSVALQWALTDHLLQAARFLFGQARLSDAIQEIAVALTEIKSSVDKEPTGLFWGQSAEAVLLLREMGFGINMETGTQGKQLPDAVAAPLRTLINRLSGSEGLSLAEAAVRFSTLFVDLSAKEPKPRRVSAHSIAAQSLAAVGNFGEASKHYQAGIALEPKNEGLWNGYGLLCLTKNYHVSQHCFIRALSLNGRNPDTWVNLSGLYLTIGDAELAIEAVERALSLEPEHPRAWLVQALAETQLKNKSNENIYRTLEYAYTLSSNDKLVSFALVLKECEMHFASHTPACLGAVTKMLSLEPYHEEANLIMGLLLERNGDYEQSVIHLELIKAWPHVARVRLSLRRFEDALKSCDLVENGGAEYTSTERLGALLTAGLSLYFLGEFDPAIERFTEALSAAAADEEEDVLCLLVEVLYASQNTDARQVALDQLFRKVEESGPTIQVVLLLAAIGILEGDSSIKDASKEELKALLVPELQGEQLAQACRLLSLMDKNNGSFQRAAFQWPSDYHLWRHIDKKQALLLAEGNLNDDIQVQALTEAGGLQNCQRAVFMDPGSSLAWESLASSIYKIW